MEPRQFHLAIAQFSTPHELVVAVRASILLLDHGIASAPAIGAVLAYYNHKYMHSLRIYNITP